MCYKYLEYISDFEELISTPKSLKEHKDLIEKLIEKHSEHALVAIEANSNYEPVIFIVER